MSDALNLCSCTVRKVNDRIIWVDLYDTDGAVMIVDCLHYRAGEEGSVVGGVGTRGGGAVVIAVLYSSDCTSCITVDADHSVLS